MMRREGGGKRVVERAVTGAVARCPLQRPEALKQQRTGRDLPTRYDILMLCLYDFGRKCERSGEGRQQIASLLCYCIVKRDCSLSEMVKVQLGMTLTASVTRTEKRLIR